MSANKDVLGPKVGAYLNLPDEDHRDCYSASEGRLSIETTSNNIKKEKTAKDQVPQQVINRITDLETKVSSLSGEIEAIKQNHARQFKELQDHLKRLTIT